MAQYIKNDKLRQLLLDKDKGKSGEHGGIGTPATRASIIQGLFDRKFLADKGKAVVSTPLGREFYAALPDQAKYPDMTALWHEQQTAISQGQLSILEFIQGINTYIASEIENVKAQPIKIVSSQGSENRAGKYPTKAMSHPKAGTASKRENSNAGAASGAVSYPCPSCGSHLRKIKGKDGFFWGCSGYPECKKTFKNGRDRPVLA